MPHRHAARVPRAREGFTLIELLVVIGVIGLITGILLPTISRVRRDAQFVQCASNMYEICTAFTAYRSAWNGKLPPNVGAPTPSYWCDGDRVGGYAAAPTPLGTGMGGGVFRCPADDGAKRSYAANFYAGSAAEGNLLKAVQGRALWDGVRMPAQVILVAEAWSSSGSDSLGYWAGPTIGAAGATPGQKFGAGTGILPARNEGRFGLQLTELAFGRHAAPGERHTPNTRPLPRERLNFAYADGHVAAKTAGELADLESGDSTGDSIWSPADLDVALTLATVH